MNMDWNSWHRHYEDPETKFAKRLATMHTLLAEVLDDRPPGPITVIDICAGQGRVTLPVVLEHPRGDDIHTVLIDSDIQCCAAARAFASEHALANVDIIHGDAGVSNCYVGCPRADIVIFSGVIRYLSRRDLRRTVRAFPQLSAAGATVLWTHGDPWSHSIKTVRRTFDHAGFRELALCEHGTMSRAHGGFAGATSLIAAPNELVPGHRWFRFRKPPIGVLGHTKRIVHGVKRRTRRPI